MNITSFFSENHRIYLGPYAEVKIDFDSRFKAVERTRNGSYIDGYANTAGTIHVTAELSNVRSHDKVLIPLNRVTAEADILVYPDLAISPPAISLPWDPVESSKCVLCYCCQLIILSLGKSHIFLKK